MGIEIEKIVCKCEKCGYHFDLGGISEDDCPYCNCQHDKTKNCDNCSKMSMCGIIRKIEHAITQEYKSLRNPPFNDVIQIIIDETHRVLGRNCPYYMHYNDES